MEKTVKIKDVQVRRYRNRGGSHYLGEVLVVDVITDDGPTGRGLALGTIAAGKFIEGMIKEILAPVIIGEDPLLTNDLWTKMYYDAAPRRAGDGYMRNAIAAIDFAL
jgi:L-alanine-DL-glutamate epimerase-like enolase superfamily enzyme